MAGIKFLGLLLRVWRDTAVFSAVVAEPSLFGIFYCVCDVVGLFVSVFGGLVAVQTGAAARFVVANNSAGNVGWCVGVVGGCGERGGGVVVGGVDLVVFCVEWR